MTSRKTQNLELPQWELNDHPDFLTEMNEAYRKIDGAITSLQEEVEELNNRLSTYIGRRLKNE